MWLAGSGIGMSAELCLETMRLTPAIPPKCSNCSPPIKIGPAWFTYIQTERQAEQLQQLLKEIAGGKFSMDKLTLGEGDIEQDDDVLDLPANQKKVLTQSRDESIEALVSRIRKGRLILQPDFQRD